jgi:hypothetical protein
VASNFKKYALDFIVVFLGISVSFGLNNLNEKRKDRVSEKNYYENLLEDARQDLSNLENQIMVCEQRLDASNKILILVQNNSSIKEIVSNSFNAVRQMSNHFKPIDATYEDLKSSGNLKLIQDNSLKNEILNYYSYLTGVTETISNGSQFATNIFIEKKNFTKAGWFHIDFVRKSIDSSKINLEKVKLNQSDRKAFDEQMISDAVLYVFINARLISLYKKIIPEVKKHIKILEKKANSY